MLHSPAEPNTKSGQNPAIARAADNPGRPQELPGSSSGRTVTNHKAFFQLQANQPATTAFQVSTDTEKSTSSTALTTRQVETPEPVTEQKSQAQDGELTLDELKRHRGCSADEHTDECWNDTRWDELNKTRRTELENRILAGEYCPMDVAVNLEVAHGKYLFSQCNYNSSNMGFGYSNNKITRSSDNKVLMDIKTNISMSRCCYFASNGEDWFMSGHSYMAPVLVNLTTEKTYEQRGDHYCPFELIWSSVEASPDGNTLLVAGLVWGGFPCEYRFYDFSRPEQGFRLLPAQSLLALPPEKTGKFAPVWGKDQDNNTTVTLAIACEDGDDSDDEEIHPSAEQVTLRREGNQMVEFDRKLAEPKQPGQ